MIGWVFTGIALLAVFVASFIGNTKRAILALWVAGLAVGGLYLTLGVEVLAIVQWVVSTLVTISFLFFSSMFGEYRPPENQGPEKITVARKRRAMAVFSVLMGLGFAAVVQLGSGALTSPGDSTATAATGNDLFSLGRELTENHLLSLEVLAFTLFLVLVGGGIIARPEAPDLNAETLPERVL